MQRPTFHLRGSISLPTTPKLLSDPYKYDYQRRRTRSAGAERRKSSTAKQSPAAVWSPSAERPQRLVSELENIIRLSETLLTSSASSRSVPSSAESTPPRTRKRKKRSSSSQASHATARCPRDSKRCLHGVKYVCPHGYAQAHCPHGFTRSSISPRDFKRCLHAFEHVCPHGYAQAACTPHTRAQNTATCLPRYEDSIFDKTARLFM
ncbi:hypothetical protein B0H15DRAFT_801949 [Mycena belliarum]|uniref:Uncharacterized protein n=1 Tax=Mycena belliarum TaxID=1033014 RepID=A0AAD6U1R1_9AGAR|nr:hypothetical protein B0H15DRAFT_801949 [Mycena belliae]